MRALFVKRSDYAAAAITMLVLSVYHIALTTREISQQSQSQAEIPKATYSAPRVPPTFSSVRKLDESEMPYKCGVLFFYHIPCTGGTSIDQWLKSQRGLNNATYFTFWGRKDEAENSFIRMMEENIKDIRPGEWKIAHAHGHSFMPFRNEQYLYLWRQQVESQGCRLVLHTVLRDAVSHTVSQSKGIINTNHTLDDWLSHLEPQNFDQRGIWNTQLDYLIYNRGARTKVKKEEKVRRAMELLQRHFDFVLYSGHSIYHKIIAKITGWDVRPLKRTNSFNQEITFTEEDFDKIRRLTISNGDVDFIDAVKHVYYNDLGYLGL